MADCLSACARSVLISPFMAGLVYLAQESVIAKGSKVLFLHTGGTPALFAYSEVLHDRLAAEMAVE